MEATSDRDRNIVDVAIDGGLQTLVAALQTAGLLRTLRMEGPFTVFAPTDEAFGRLPPPLLSRLFQPEHRHELAALLRYHVVPGRMTSRQIATVDAARTSLGAEVAISTQVRTVQVNQALVTLPDLLASNGVVHAIDAVLRPPADRAAVQDSQPAPRSAGRTWPSQGFAHDAF